MSKRRNDPSSAGPEKSFFPPLAFLFPFFLVFLLGFGKDSFPVALSPAFSSLPAAAADVILVLALLNAALAAGLASPRTAALRRFGLFLLAASGLAVLEGALDLAVITLFTAWLLSSASGAQGRNP